MAWNTSRFDAEQPMDSGGWRQIPGRKQQEEESMESRPHDTRHQQLMDTLDYAGATAMVFTMVVLLLLLWGLI